MYFTYVVRPGEAPEGRGPQFEPFWAFCVNYNLRLGLLVQLVAYATLLATTTIGGKDPLSLLRFFRCNPESVGKSPLWAAQLACGLFVLGNLTTMAFQSLTDDDS
ncbi:Chromosome III, complete sequence, related, partial [Eimeria acervulina]